MKQVPERVDKPWGYELIWAHTSQYVGKVLHIHSGESLSLQYHEVKDETIFLFSGEMRFWVGPDRVALRNVSIRPLLGSVDREPGLQDQTHHEP